MRPLLLPLALAEPLEPPLCLLQVSLHLDAAPRPLATVSKERSVHDAVSEGNAAAVSPLARRWKLPPPTQSSTDVLRTMGVYANEAGDLKAFWGAFLTNSIVLAICVLAFSVLRLWYPQVYANNVRLKEDGGFGTAPSTPSDSLFGWVCAGLFVSVDVAQQSTGLDTALMLEFLSFSMKLLAIIGIPVMLVLCPLHALAGGHIAEKQGDKLSALGMDNVSDDSMIFYIHALLVWWVVVGAETMVYRAMRGFLKMRFKWLQELRRPRCTTVLVENIPEAQRSDERLRQFFTELFPGNAIEAVHLVKFTERLVGLNETLSSYIYSLEQAEFQWKKTGNDPEQRPTLLIMGYRYDSIEYYWERIELVMQQMTEEKERISTSSCEPLEDVFDENDQPTWQLSENAAQVNTSSGFVTFASKRDAMLALRLQCTADTQEFMMSVPPDPEDVLYSNVGVSLQHQRFYSFLGHAWIFGIFAGFLPLVTLVAAATNLQSLSQVPPIRSLLRSYPFIAQYLEGVISSLALTLFSFFLPSILLAIIHGFFYKNSSSDAQLRLQEIYFWFQVVFVLLVTAVGGSLLGRFGEIIETPALIFRLLAATLPDTTHFYINFMVMQWATHAISITRCQNLCKYLTFRFLVNEQRAVEWAEPEDQQYYGIGARTARWSMHLTVALVFCTLSPLILLFTFANFLIARIVYGYLLVFAETRKHDMGGNFWVTQLWHVQYGLLIFDSLMLGVLYYRMSSSYGPIIMAAPTLPYLVYSMFRFHTGFRWQELPFHHACLQELEGTGAKAPEPDLPQVARCYVQPELLDTGRTVRGYLASAEPVLPSEQPQLTRATTDLQHLQQRRRLSQASACATDAGAPDVSTVVSSMFEAGHRRSCSCGMPGCCWRRG